jgi:hypothetical protein
MRRMIPPHTALGHCLYNSLKQGTQNMGNYVSTINKEVDVTALYFGGKSELKSFPRRIAYDNREITFLESGMRYLVQKGNRMIQLFDMSDGIRQYRLQFDPQAFTWTLLRITNVPRALY